MEENEFVGFYDKLPDFNTPLILKHNTTGEIRFGQRTHEGLFSDNSRISGSEYSWKYFNKN